MVFPEFYEEGVENTPARILMTQMHGSGMHYRNCFYEKRFDFHAYDGCFLRARAQEREDLVLELAVSRLRFPFDLGAEERAVYEGYLREHLSQAGGWAVDQRDMELLRWLIQDFLFGEEAFREKGQAREGAFEEKSFCGGFWDRPQSRALRREMPFFWMSCTGVFRWKKKALNFNFQ